MLFLSDHYSGLCKPRTQVQNPPIPSPLHGLSSLLLQPQPMSSLCSRCSKALTWAPLVSQLHDFNSLLTGTEDAILLPTPMHVFQIKSNPVALAASTPQRLISGYPLAGWHGTPGPPWYGLSFDIHSFSRTLTALKARLTPSHHPPAGGTRVPNGSKLQRDRNALLVHSSERAPPST